MKKILDDLRSCRPYYITCVLAFFLLPFLFGFPGADGLLVFLFNYIFLLPLVCFIISIIFSRNNGFKFLFPIGVGIFFIPSTFMQEFMDIGISSTLAIGIFVVSLIGCGLGNALYARRESN